MYSLEDKKKESDLKGKDCEEDDEAEGDACSNHDGVHCVDQTHLGNGIIIDKPTKVLILIPPK